MIKISIPPERWNLLFINILFYQYIILFYFINIINILFYISLHPLLLNNFVLFQMK